MLTKSLPSEFSKYKAQFKDIQIQNYINGEYTISNKRMEMVCPSTGTPFGSLPLSGQDQVNVAVNSATEAFKSWSLLSTTKRSLYLLLIAEILESRMLEFAVAESLDQGKPLSLSLSLDIPRAVHNFRSFAQSVSSHSTRSTIDGGFHNYVLEQPIGVVGLITPWNLPLYLLTWKLAPCLVSGCTCVIKPSELTSLTAYLLIDVLKEAGIPNGVVNFVFGGGETGTYIVEHEDIKGISFTGGTLTGLKIYQACAGVRSNPSKQSNLSIPRIKKASLELGGKNASVIFADCDLDNAVKTTVRSSFLNQGEICLCMSRVYVHESIYDQFLEKFVPMVKQLQTGNPFDRDTDVGALVSEAHMKKVLKYIQIAKDEGCHILCGGEQIDQDGYYIAPTVITNVRSTSVLQHEEIFGPVVTISKFHDVDEVVQYVNDTEYGLACCLWTSNINTVHQLTNKIETGYFWINCWMVRDLGMPFGGWKQSGIGRESTKDSYEFFCEKKSICVKL